MGTRSKGGIAKRGKRCRVLQAFQTPEEWCESMRGRGKSEILIMLAQVICSAGEACFFVREKSRQREFLNQGPSIELSQWLSFYQNPFRITSRLVRHILPQKMIGGPKKHRLSTWVLYAFEGWQILDCVPAEVWKQEINDLPLEERQEMARDIAENLKVCQQFGPEVRDIFRRLTADDESDYAPGEINPRRLSQVPELVFAFQVLYPCLLEYQRNAYELFQQARDGDWDAICLLVRLDKRIMHDPEIGQRISEACQKCPERQDAIAAAYQGPPDTKLHRMTMKIGLAAFLRVVSQQKKESLSFREIRRLMDAYARRDGKNCDEDLPLSDEAFAQDIKRAVRKLKLEEWDIFSWLKCPAFEPEQPLSSGHENEPQDSTTEAA